MFDFLFLCTFGSWRRRWCVTNILIPRRLQRVRSRKADTIFSSVMCFLFFFHYHPFQIGILPAVLEALSQGRHHILVVFHQGSEDRRHSPLDGNMAQVTYLSMEEYFDTSSRFKSSGKSLRMWKARMYSSCCGGRGHFLHHFPKLKAKWSHLKMVI